jgi:hypothetical protein
VKNHASSRERKSTGRVSSPMVRDLMFLTTPMIDAAAVDATAKGILSRENVIDEGLVCGLDSEADREYDGKNDGGRLGKTPQGVDRGCRQDGEFSLIRKYEAQNGNVPGIVLSVGIAFLG